MQVRDQIAQAKGTLAGEEPKRTQITTGVSKPHEEVKLQLLKQEPLLAALKAKALAVQEQLAVERKSLQKLNDDELQIVQLERQVELEDANYRMHVTSLEQSRVDEATAAAGQSNISVVQPATFDTKPVKPRKLLNLALGFVLGCFGGLGLAFLAESLDETIKSPEELESRLDLPTLAALPRLPPRQMQLNGGTKA